MAWRTSPVIKRPERPPRNEDRTRPGIAALLTGQSMKVTVLLSGRAPCPSAPPRQRPAQRSLMMRSCFGRSVDTASDERPRVSGQIHAVVPQVPPDRQRVRQLLVHNRRREALERNNALIANHG